MRTFDTRYENGWFFIDLVKSCWKSSKGTNEKLKTSVLDGPSDNIQKFTKLHYYYVSKSLAEITHFNINTGLKYPKLGRNLQRKLVSVQFSQNF